MIIFLYGEDTYRSRKKLKDIVQEYKKIHKSGLNLKHFEADDFNLLNDETRQNSMFQEKKLIIVQDPLSKASFREKFMENSSKFFDSNDVFLFFQEGKADERTAMFKLLKKKAKAQEFKKLSGAKLKNWIKKEFQKYNVKTTEKVINFLAENIGNDLWRMSNEIQKLASYKKEINLEDVKKLVRLKIEADIFKTIDAIAQKNKKEALKLLHKHIDKGDSPIYLLSMINYQFRNLLIVKDLVDKKLPYNLIVKKSGLHPFVVKKTYSVCNRFDLENLKKIYKKILIFDLKIKTGQIEPEIALDLFVSEI